MGIVLDSTELGGLSPKEPVCVFSLDNFDIKPEEDILAILDTWKPPS